MTIDLSTDTHERIYGPTTDLDNPSSSSPLWATHLNRVPFNHSRGRDIMMDSSCQGNYNPSFLTTTTLFHLLNDRRDNDHWSPYCGWFSCVCVHVLLSRIETTKETKEYFLYVFLGLHNNSFRWTTNECDLITGTRFFWWLAVLWWSVVLLFFHPTWKGGYLQMWKRHRRRNTIIYTMTTIEVKIL